MSAKYTFLAWDTPITNPPLKLALLQLADNADDAGFSYYSVSKMAKSCGMSDRTFMRKISELEKMGVLTVERRANRPSLYTLIGDEMGVTLCHLQKTEVTECHGGVTECHAQGDRVSHDPKIDPNTSPESIINECFDLFWMHGIHSSKPLSLGLKKANRVGALKAFKAQCKKLPDNYSYFNGDSESDGVNGFTMMLIDDIAKRCELNQFGFDNSLHPATYLNSQRWTDEYETNQQASTAGGRKLNAVEANAQRLLAKHGHATAPTERVINPVEHTGLDQHEVLGSVRPQVEPYGSPPYVEPGYFYTNDGED